MGGIKGQPLFAGVEELIDKISLGAHAAGQQEFHEQVREGMLLMHHLDHLFPCNPERHARVERGGCGQAQSGHRRKGLLTNKVATGEKRDGGLFALVRNHRKLCPAALKIENRVGRISLREKGLTRLQVGDSSTNTSACKIGDRVERHVALIRCCHWGPPWRRFGCGFRIAEALSKAKWGRLKSM